MKGGPFGNLKRSKVSFAVTVLYAAGMAICAAIGVQAIGYTIETIGDMITQQERQHDDR
jgi:hypothetical protein